ncbi:MAG: DUF5721 family protein [Lachnospiraceae bacterium]|nr:DUF5721 family protein [Lachnospiraceae bacterium]
MTAIRVNDIKRFMELLLSGDAFDKFMFIEAEVGMGMDYRISGRINRTFYTQDENEIMGPGTFHPWADAKESVRLTVKGKRLPVRMKVVLQKQSDDGKQILNIRFNPAELVVVTGFAQNGFTTDKQPERDWDSEAFAFLKGLGLNVDIC